MMTKKEMYELVKERVKELEEDFFYIGVRFENKERQVGEIITDVSRHNGDREDEREFPDFDTEEYYEMEELDGVSAWDAHIEEHYKYKTGEGNEPASKGYLTEHCYLIASDDAVNPGDDIILDEGEIVLENAKVIEVLF
jgi:hypothetical protein